MVLGMIEVLVRIKAYVEPNCRDLYGVHGVPVKSYSDDAGFDLRSCEDVTIPPLERKAVGTGLHIAMHDLKARLGDYDICFFTKIMDRSGQALKKGLHTLAGVIDPGYTGEIKVVVFNASREPVEIKRGERIAQLVILPTLCATLEPVTDINQLGRTNRGHRGFGSTGLIS